MRRNVWWTAGLCLLLAGCGAQAERPGNAAAVAPPVEAPLGPNPATDPASEPQSAALPGEDTPPDSWPDGPRAPDSTVTTSAAAGKKPVRSTFDPQGLPAAVSPAQPEQDRRFTRVRIYYATDRQRGGDTPHDFYTDTRSPETDTEPFEFGQCEVSVPYRHDPGEIERPSLWKLELREDPARHVVLLVVRPIPRDQCLVALQAAIQESQSKAAIVFVHGFNVPFDAAARRSAQMKYDLGFDGPVVLYSWPAPANYVECEGNAVWTKAHLQEFLNGDIQRCGAEKIHLIAHSMGTRVLTDTLRDLVAASGSAGTHFNQVILAAPDIDAQIFRQQIAPRIAGVAQRISIYASSNDLALIASKKAHSYVRLGEAGANLTVFPTLPQFDVLDATQIDESLLGHSYYGDSPTILRDMRFVLDGREAPARGLQARTHHYLFSRP